MSAIGYKNAQGRIERSIAVMSDVSEQARTQNALLKQSEQRFRNSFEAAAHGMAILSVDGRISAVNGAMVGYPRGQGTRPSVEELHGHRPCRRRHQGSGHRQQDPHRQRWWWPCRACATLSDEERVVHALTSISPVRDANGKVDQFILQVVDITSQPESRRASAPGAEDGGCRSADRWDSA